MRRITVVLIAVLFAFLGLLDVADAAKQKKAKPVAPPKPIYEAPMRVVIVRNSNPACEPSCPQWIAAEGEITGATPALFRKVLKQMGKEKLPVIIRSPGGSINAALEIGKMLRQRKMTAAVGATIYRGCSPADSKCKLPKGNKGIYDGMITEDWAFCNSACPMVLAGATTRYASYRTSVGLHEPKTTWLSTRTNFREFYRMVNGKKKVISRKILSKKTFVSKTTYGLDKQLRKRLSNYYKTMGVDVAILEEMVKAKYKDIYILPDDKRATLKLRTTMEQAVFLGNPKLCGSGATSAVCVLDKSRDPNVLAMAREKSLGIDPAAKPMTFRLVELARAGCGTQCPKMIVAEGRITSTTQDNFVTFLTSVKPGKASVLLHSQGGDISAALHMAQRIRMSGAATIIGEVKNKGQRVTGADIVEGTCKGVCAVVFAGGVSRFVTAKQKIELFHPDVLSGGMTQKAVQLNSTLITLDVKRELMSTLHKLKKDKSTFIAAEDAVRYQLATQVQPMVLAIERASCKHATAPIECRAQPMPLVRTSLRDSIAKDSKEPVLVLSSSPYCKDTCAAWISVSGYISAETEESVRKLYRSIGSEKPPLVIDSRGGDLAVAMRLAAFLRVESITVAVGKTEFQGCKNDQPCISLPGGAKYIRGQISNRAACEGACFFVLAGGKHRISDSGVPLKLYGLNFLNAHTESTIGPSEVQQFFSSMSQSAQVADMLLSIPGDEHYSFLAKSQSVNGVINSGSLPDWLDDTERCGVVAARTVCMRRN